MSDLRKAALTLHALTDGDRTWLLDRLEPAQRQSLEALLCELANLGIPPDARLLQRAVAAANDGNEAPPARATLDTLAPEDVQALLRGEPAGLVARVLAVQAWTWSEGFLRALDASERRRVGEAARDGLADAPSLDDWLLADLVRRSHAAAGGASHESAPADERGAR